MNTQNFETALYVVHRALLQRSPTSYSPETNQARLAAYRDRDKKIRVLAARWIVPGNLISRMMLRAPGVEVKRNERLILAYNAGYMPKILSRGYGLQTVQRTPYPSPAPIE
jgi:hypothetical protein